MPGARGGERHRPHRGPRVSAGHPHDPVCIAQLAPMGRNDTSPWVDQREPAVPGLLLLVPFGPRPVRAWRLLARLRGARDAAGPGVGRGRELARRHDLREPLRAWAAPPPESPGGRHEGDRDPRARRSRGGEPPRAARPGSEARRGGRGGEGGRAQPPRHLGAHGLAGAEARLPARARVGRGGRHRGDRRGRRGGEGRRRGGGEPEPRLRQVRALPLGQREPLPALRDPRRARLGRDGGEARGLRAERPTEAREPVVRRGRRDPSRS